MSFGVFVIILVEINVEGVSLEMCKKMLLYVAKIKQWNKCTIVKDIEQMHLLQHANLVADIRSLTG